MRISDWSSDVCSSDLIGDELADGLFGLDPTAPQPLALFDALRTDFSLARLRHYTGTAPEHFQRYILFTNYHRYVDEFVAWAGAQVGQGRYTALAGAGGLYVDKAGVNATALVADSRSEEHTSELQSLMRISYAVLCLTKNKQIARTRT